MRKYVRDYLIMIINSLVIGAGVALVVYGNLGADSLTTFEQGASVSTGLELSLCQMIINFSFAILLFVINRKKVSLPTFIIPFLIPLGLKLTMLFLQTVDNIIIRYVYMLGGIVVIGLGIGIGAQSEISNNPYDGLILTLSEKFKISFGVLRPIIDAVILAIGILLGGTWGVGTVIATFCQGFVANFFIKFLKGKF